MILKRRKPQFLRPADQPRAIPNEMQLEAIALRKLRNHRAERRKTTCLNNAISVDEKQHRAPGNLNPSISRRRYSGVRLSDQSQRIAFTPAPDRFRGRFLAPVVDNDYLKTGFVRLLRQRLKTAFEKRPVVVDGDDDT